MQIETYDRKPFSVKAVQVDFKNVNEVAEWCNGTVITQEIKMLGVKTEVPAIRLEGQGDNRGKSFIASLGCYVVEFKGSFRVYKPQYFDDSFVKAQVEEKPCESCGLLHCEACDGVAVEHLIEDALSSQEILDECPDAKFENA